MTDYYSALLSETLKNKVKNDNAQTHLEIEQFKMGSFANRVVDSYTKKF